MLNVQENGITEYYKGFVEALQTLCNHITERL